MLKSKSGASTMNDVNICNNLWKFLQSAVWSLPVASFVEQHSIVFDREHGDVQLYRQVHNEYTAIVDALIEGFCADLGIRPQQLVAALQAIDHGNQLTNKQRHMLEPVIAAQDFEVFVPMMMRKNVELQLQALQMIEFMCGLLPSVLMLDDDDFVAASMAKSIRDPLDPEEQDRFILIQVMRQSKEEFERDQANRAGAQLELDHAIKESAADRKRLEDARNQEQLALQEAMKNANIDDDDDQVPDEKQQISNKTRPASAKVRPPSGAKSTTTTKSPPVNINNLEVEPTDIKNGKPTTKTTVNLQKRDQIPDEAMRARAAYLRMQRDKLLAMKKAAREKVFADNAHTATDRPKTARAARGALRGQIPDKIGDDMLAARRALAIKLKQEVINSTSSNGV